MWIIFIVHMPSATKTSARFECVLIWCASWRGHCVTSTVRNCEEPAQLNAGFQIFVGRDAVYGWMLLTHFEMQKKIPSSLLIKKGAPRTFFTCNGDRSHRRFPSDSRHTLLIVIRSFQGFRPIRPSGRSKFSPLFDLIRIFCWNTFLASGDHINFMFDVFGALNRADI